MFRCQGSAEQCGQPEYNFRDETPKHVLMFEGSLQSVKGLTEAQRDQIVICAFEPVVLETTSGYWLKAEVGQGRRRDKVGVGEAGGGGGGSNNCLWIASSNCIFIPPPRPLAGGAYRCH